MSARPLRRARRRVASTLGIALGGLASRGGPVRIKRIGSLIGRMHYWLSWPFNQRLRRDIARVLGISRREAGVVLSQAFRDNDRAVFEIVTLAHPDCDPQALIDTVRIENMARLEAAATDGRGAILLGMHMGNGILMAARLARAGFPIHVVFRDPRRLPPGLLGRSLERAGCVPVPLDRENPTRSFRQMLKILASGGMLYVLMDQANKGEGAPRRFLGKSLRMPSGIPSLAVRTGAPVFPVHAEAAAPEWRFRVHPPLIADDADAMLDAMLASMQSQIMRHPELWAWHHRRWKRYHFDT
ncbi:MAG: hypothetical protein CMP07_00660 [Xanthomonadales bacterium]|nr:hypothetical protein [Xanthomonadales bacterium]